MALKTLTHPRENAARAGRLARDTVYFGIGVTTRFAAGAVNVAAGLLDRRHDSASDRAAGTATAPPVEPMPGPTPVPAPDPVVPDPGPGPDGPPAPEPEPAPLGAGEAGQADPDAFDPADAESVLVHATGTGDQPGGTAVADAQDDELRTPSGIPAADPAHNPDTTDSDLHQVGTAEPFDPATVKALEAEAETLRKAAEVDKR